MTQSETPQPPAVPDAGVGEYIRGFTTSLRRYRTMTIFGWVITGAGFISLVVGWRASSASDVLDLALSCLSMAAGVSVVHVSVQALDEYVKVVISALERHTSPGADAGPHAELLTLLKDVEAGGWQEAFIALRRMRMLDAQSGSPVDQIL